MNNIIPQDRNGSTMQSPDPWLFGGQTQVPAPTGEWDARLSAGQFLQVRWWMIGAAVLVLILALPLIWLFNKPVYEATAVVHVSPVVSRIAFNTGDNGIVPFYDAYMNTQVSFIRSPTVLQRILDRKDIRNTNWFKQAPERFWSGERITPLERLKSVLVVTPLRETELIKVSVTDGNAKEAKLLADAVVDEYKGYVDDSFQKGDLRRFDALQEEQRSLQNEISGLLTTKFNLAQGLGAADPEELRTTLNQGLETLISERAKHQREVDLSQWELQRGTEPANDDSGDRHYAADAEWQRLSAALEESRHQLEVARQRFGKLHPNLQQASETVEFAERALRAREGQIDAAQVARASMLSPETGAAGLPRSRETIQYGIDLLQQRISLLDSEIEQQRTKLAQATSRAQDLARFDEDIHHKREMYEAVRTRLNELSLESKAPARISIAAYAVEPSVPQHDRRILLSLLAFGGAMMAGVAVGYVRIRLDPTVAPAIDVQSTVGLPVLGHLPRLDFSPSLVNDMPAVLVERSRMIRTALVKEIGDQHSTFVVTSASAGAGKSTVSYYLAHSFAALGRKTLLIEADLRHPCLSDRIGVTDGVGLFSVLTKQVDFTGAIHHLGDSLDAIFAGKPNPEFRFELLGSTLLRSMLQEWRTLYDIIIFDTPPALPVADSQILAGQADATLMVIRAGHCSRSGVLQALSDLPARGARLLGTVMIGSRPSAPYGYHNHSYGYGYEPVGSTGIAKPLILSGGQT